MYKRQEVIYAERRRVLNGESMRDVVYKMIKDVVADDVNMLAGEQPLKEMNLVELNESLRRKIPLEPITLTDEEKEKNDKEALISRLQDEAMKIYHKKEKDFNEFAKVNVPDVYKRQLYGRMEWACACRWSSYRRMLL